MSGELFRLSGPGRALKDEELGAKRLRPAAWGPAAPAAFGTRTAATTSWLPPAPPAPYVVAASAAAPRLV